MLDFLPDWLIIFLVLLNPHVPSLIVATVGGLFAGYLAGRKATELLHDEHVENIRPTIRIGGPHQLTIPNVWGARGNVMAADHSTPVRLLAYKVDWRCDSHHVGQIIEGTWQHFPPNTQLAASGSTQFDCAMDIPPEHPHCRVTPLSWIRYEDYKGFQIYEANHLGAFRIITAKSRLHSILRWYTGRVKSILRG